MVVLARGLPPAFLAAKNRFCFNEQQTSSWRPEFKHHQQQDSLLLKLQPLDPCLPYDAEV